jgi:hypothetical protein
MPTSFYFELNTVQSGTYLLIVLGLFFWEETDRNIYQKYLSDEDRIG